MEIEIDSKRNNPLLNRTEIYFTIKHEGEGTPNREIIRSELAEKLNVNKENVIVNTVHSSFGNQEITGYAKVYSSLAKSKDIELDYILKRNRLIEGEKKKAEEKPAAPPKEEGAEEKPAEEKPAEPIEEPVPESKITEESPKAEETPAPEPPKEEVREDSAEPGRSEEKPAESTEEAKEEKKEKKPSKEESSEESEQSAEEKKE